jgi:hypothetical protein
MFLGSDWTRNHYLGMAKCIKTVIGAEGLVSKLPEVMKALEWQNESLRRLTQVVAITKMMDSPIRALDESTKRTELLWKQASRLDFGMGTLAHNWKEMARKAEIFQAENTRLSFLSALGGFHLIQDMAEQCKRLSSVFELPQYLNPPIPEIKGLRRISEESKREVNRKQKERIGFFDWDGRPKK